MGWVSFIDPFLFKDQRLQYYGNNSNIPLYVPNINKGKVIRIVDYNTIQIVAIYLNKVSRFMISLKDVVKRDIKPDDSSAWKNYTLYHYLEKTLIDKIVHIRNISYSSKGALIGDIYLGKNHINKIVVEIGLATNKSVKFSD